MLKQSLPWATILYVLMVLSVPAGDWPQWRGPAGQGHAETGNLPLHWSETQNVTWKTPIPGRGWSSPVLLGTQIWVTTAHEKESDPAKAAERLKGTTNDQPMTLLDEVRLHALCLDKASGRILYDIELLREEEPQAVHKLNSYASPTPVIEAGRVYCHFGSFGTACIDTQTGQVLWRNTDLRIKHENGPGGSPVLWNDFLIFHCDGSDRQYIVALDKETGKVAWRTDRSGTMRDHPQMKKAYGTPLIIDIQNQPHLLSTAADWLYSYEPQTGRELWKLSYETLGFSNVPRPVVGHGLIYLSTGFMRPQLLAVRYDSAAPPAIAWSYQRGVPTVPSPLLAGGELYFINDSGGMVTCLDAKTGEELWKERLGGNHVAAPLHADGRIHFFSQEGVTAVLQPGKTYQLLAQNQLDGGIFASPAAVDEALFIRTDQALYRIQAARP